MERTRGSVFQATFLLLLIFRFVYAIEQRPRFNRSPEKIVAPLGDLVSLECEMNVKPDSIRWRHFPLNSPYNTNPIPIETGLARDVPNSTYKNSEKRSRLTFTLNDTQATGDYQCLVTYGASVLASVLGRVTIAEMEDFTNNSTTKHLVSEGNTVLLRCDLPPSNPPATVIYYKSTVPMKNAHVTPNGSLLLKNISYFDSATYTCAAKNQLTMETKRSRQSIILTVTSRNDRSDAPRFLVPPASNYTVKPGDSVMLECAAVGNPPPSVVWRKLNGEIPVNRTVMVPWGLMINDVGRGDQGTYECGYRGLVHHITVLIEEKPAVSNLSTIEINEGDDHEVRCSVSGSPEPTISWWINGQSVLNDSNIEAIGNMLYFQPVEKRHAGMYQCFAHNKVGSDFSYSQLRVIPKQISSASEVASVRRPAATPPTKHHKKQKMGKNGRARGNRARMVPPSKPNITRLSDESVMVRWSVPENDGLPIQFFKVQYRELGPASHGNKNSPNLEQHQRTKPSRWKTTNADIIPHLRNYQVDNLKPDHIYRFRIAAVYSNNDNLNGPNSVKFHLKREDFLTKNQLPAPLLTHTEAISSTSIAIHWEYTPDPKVPIEGFYVNFQAASSAGDYYKATVDGEKSRSYIINHLAPDTSYDIKLQSYTQSGVSDFSPIMKQKTKRLEGQEVQQELTTSPPPIPTSDGSKRLYMVVGAAVAGLAVLLACAVMALMMVVSRCKREKEATGEATTNGYAASKPPHHVMNGRITITANPLADADDHQNQNVIEMACLSSAPASPGNNNGPSAPTNAAPAASPGDNYV